MPVHQVLSWKASNENTNVADEQMCVSVQSLRVSVEVDGLDVQRVHSPFELLELCKTAAFNCATAGDNFQYGMRDLVTDSLFALCFLIFVFALSAFVMGCKGV